MGCTFTADFLLHAVPKTSAASTNILIGVVIRDVIRLIFAFATATRGKAARTFVTACPRAFSTQLRPPIAAGGKAGRFRLYLLELQNYAPGVGNAMAIKQVNISGTEESRLIK